MTLVEALGWIQMQSDLVKAVGSLPPIVAIVSIWKWRRDRKHASIEHCDDLVRLIQDAQDGFVEAGTLMARAIAERKGSDVVGPLFSNYRRKSDGFLGACERAAFQIREGRILRGHANRMLLPVLKRTLLEHLPEIQAVLHEVADAQQIPYSNRLSEDSYSELRRYVLHFVKDKEAKKAALLPWTPSPSDLITHSALPKVAAATPQLLSIPSAPPVPASPRLKE